MTTKTDHVRGERGYLSPAAQRGLFELPRRREFLVRAVGAPPKRVLDTGCAGGHVSLMLRKLGHDVVALELNDRMAREARRRGIAVVQHDLELPLPLADESFDAVHACEIVEHLFDTEGFLAELRRVLVAGGVLVVSTPNLNSLANRARVVAGRPLPMWGAYPTDLHGSHVRVLNRRKLVELLERTGFEVREVTGMNDRPGLLDRVPTLSKMLLARAVRRR